MAKNEFPYISETRRNALLNQLAPNAISPELKTSPELIQEQVRSRLSYPLTFTEFRELAHCLNHAAYILDPSSKNHIPQA